MPIRDGDMSDFWDRSAARMINLGERRATSQAFSGLFREGMDLVEQAAAYLDGPGREESRTLGRAGALVYARESMRLTTRLMQLASWLLLQRALNEGELGPEEARREKSKVDLGRSEPLDAEEAGLIPEKLRDLIADARHLQLRIHRLDTSLKADEAVPVAPNAVARQLGMLRAAFEAR